MKVTIQAASSRLTMTFKHLPGPSAAKLWSHQRKALRFVIDHLNTRESACLVRMPTGTGKTGVIACLTNFSCPGNSLVLTPWANLRDQMVDDLKLDFWENASIQPNAVEVTSMLPSSAQQVAGSTQRQIIVATFATLNELRIEHPDTYNKLAAILSLVVVDEGHYEPAVEWGKSVKGLKAKTVLLTATPYRNDLKLFRITDPENSTHHYTHKAAVADGIIRELAFESLPDGGDLRILARDFADEWKRAKAAARLPSRSPRAIVCCRGDEYIEAAVEEFRRCQLKAIGIHENFENSGKAYLVKTVPRHEIDEEIWVHQNKLTEGLDDNRFCCIALLTPIRNDRKLIQQIGRILRRAKNDRSKPALLFSPAANSPEDEWASYLEFETDFRLLDPQHFRNVVDTLLNTQPTVEYFEGRFRRRFDPSQLSRSPQVVLPPSILVRRVGRYFSLDDYIEDCTDTLNTQDAVILGPNPNAPCQRAASHALWVYGSVRNSRSLSDTSLYEIRLETHCVVLVEGYVFVSDSRGNYPTEYLEQNSSPAGTDELTRFLDDSFRPTHVSVDSSIPYDTVLRGANLRGHDLLSVATSLTDRIQICRAARGYSKTDGRRYVGIMNGRLRKEVSEQERRNFDLSSFVAWTETVAALLKSKTTASPLFRRYMPVCPPPANPVPKAICIDVMQLDLQFRLSDGSECVLRRSAANIDEQDANGASQYICTFEVESKEVTNASVSLRLQYDRQKRRFTFSKASGVSLQVESEDNGETQAKGFAEFLSQNQDLLLIALEGGLTVYQGRNFYAVDYSYAEEVLVGLITRVLAAPKCKSEKGNKSEIADMRRAKATKFPANSLFRAIADGVIDLPFTPEVLICVDLGTECADFIAASFSRKQLALLHAKVGGNTKISASAFHEVVSQAMKNLVYFTRTAEVPNGASSWRRGARWNKTEVGRLLQFDDTLPTGRALWKKLQNDIIFSTNPGLFAVLVTAGCCDVNSLRAAITDPTRRTPETAQLLHLLDGLNGYSRQLGVQLLIRDLPFDPN